MTRVIPDLRQRRAGTVLAIGAAAVLTMAAAGLWHGPTFLLWNASASVPVGLYVVFPTATPHVGDLAVADLPNTVRELAARRQYLPRHVLLIKPVVAEHGARVCRYGDMIFINDMWIADARPLDRERRALPQWQGCRVLSHAELFLLNPQVNDSFDGRYFGPVDRSLSHGRAWPILTFRPRDDR